MARSRYAMFSDEGDAAVAVMVERLLLMPISTSDTELYSRLTTLMNEIAKTHGEVWDTDVREAIIGEIERRTHRELSIYF
jgi:hypothetical protein